jgi:uncharacterized membrane protein YbhN (UPF0104 family)
MSTKPARKVKFWDLLKVSIALILLAFVISSTDLHQIRLLWHKLSPAWMGITFLLFLLLTVLKASQYYFLVGRALPYSRVLGITIFQNAITNFVAAAAGIASQITLMTVEQDVRFGRAAFSFIVAKMGDLFAVSILLLISSFWVRSQVRPTHGIVLTLLTVSFVLILLFLLALFFRGRFEALVRKGLSFFKLDRFGFVQQGLFLMSKLVLQDRRDIIRLLLYGIGYSMLYMLVTIAWAYARFRTFSLTMDVGVITYVASILQFASWFPVFVFGGLGISETMSVYLYGNFGVNKPELAAILLGSRLIFYLMNGSMLLYIPLENFIANRRISS